MLINDIRKLLKIQLGPGTQNKDFIKIRCYCDFEPFGIASEDWDEVWELELPQILSHWKSTISGWQRTTTDSCMKFKGRTLEEVMIKAKAFLEEFNKL